MNEEYAGKGELSPAPDSVGVLTASESFQPGVPKGVAFPWKPFLIAGGVMGVALLAGVVWLPTRSSPSAQQSAVKNSPAAAAAPLPALDSNSTHSPNTTSEVRSLPRAEAQAVSPETGKAWEMPQPARSVSRKFNPPAVPALSSAQSGTIDAPPALSGPTSTAPILAVPLQVPAVSPPPAAVSPAPAAVPPPPVKEIVPAARQITVASNLQSANLIKMVPPVYPPFARSTRIQGIVRFKAVIGRDGRILNFQLMSGPPPLAQAASDAVKQWVYKPTLLNGEPVEVVTQIDVKFTLDQ